MKTIWHDIRYGLRMLAKNPGFTAITVLIIGLGIGANTTIFNTLDQLSMRALPVPNAHELVNIQFLNRSGKGQSVGGTFNYPVYEACRDQSNVFAGLAAFSSAREMRLYTGQEVKRIQASAVSGSYFSVFGIDPDWGRLFNSQQEPDPGVHSVVVISDRFRQQQFGVDDDIIGERIVIEHHALTIVGVTPPGFNGSNVGHFTDVYIPLGTYAEICEDDINIHEDRWIWLHLSGRLKPRITRVQAEASLNVVNSRLKTTDTDNVHEHLRLVSGSHGWMSGDAADFVRPLVLFMVVAIFILVIMSANIANMQLSRAITRHKEIAIRQALGASRWRVIRQLLIESLLLALAGGICGIVLTLWLDSVVCVLISRIGSVSMFPGLNLRILVFALTVSLIMGLLFGLTPALQMVRRKVTLALKESTIVADMSLRRRNLCKLLVVLQVAIAVVVLVCGGLFVRSIIALNRINPGYDTSKLLTVSLEGLNFDRPDLRCLFEDLHERIRDLPGMEVSCLSNVIPLGEVTCGRTVTHIDGALIPQNEQKNWRYVVVDLGYFKTLNMPLLAGRSFTPKDNLHTEKVMVINDVMARQCWPNQNPLGKTVTYRGYNKGIPVKIVGVVKNAKMCSLTESDWPCAYWPLAQDRQYTPALLMRTSQDPKPFIPILRREVAELGFNEIVHISTVSDRVAELLYPQQATTIILNVFGLAGLLLCILGIYGVMVYTVKQRTREIGIRMALGAEPHRVVMSVLGKGACLMVIGLGLGLGISFIALRILEGQLVGLRGWNKFLLYGVNLWDPVILVLIPFIVFSVAGIACYIPARRAAKIDPMEALRYE